LNTFLDGVLVGSTYKHNATIRKTMCNPKYTSNIQKQIKRVLDPRNKEQNIRDKEFMNNYTGLIRGLLNAEMFEIEAF
jgi:hypothetical protein